MLIRKQHAKLLQQRIKKGPAHKYTNNPLRLLLLSQAIKKMEKQLWQIGVGTQPPTLSMSMKPMSLRRKTWSKWLSLKSQ